MGKIRPGSKAKKVILVAIAIVFIILTNTLITIDGVDPVVEITNSNLEYQVGELEDIKTEEDLIKLFDIKVSDNKSDEKEIILSLDEDLIHSIDFSEEGVYSFTITAEDTAGNNTSKDVSLTITPTVQEFDVYSTPVDDFTVYYKEKNRTQTEIEEYITSVEEYFANSTQNYSKSEEEYRVHYRNDYPVYWEEFTYNKIQNTMSYRFEKSGDTQSCIYYIENDVVECTMTDYEDFIDINIENDEQLKLCLQKALEATGDGSILLTDSDLLYYFFDLLYFSFD